MKYFFFFLISLFLFLPQTTLAQSQQSPTILKQEFFKAKVVKILDEGIQKVGTTENIFQRVQVQFLEGPEKDQEATIEYGGIFTITDEQKVAVNDTVIITKTQNASKAITYTISDTYRLDTLLVIFAVFFVLVIFIAGRKGLGAFMGMVVSLAVIVGFIIPQILQGVNPLFVSIVGSLFIMLVTIYLAHGLSQRTTIAVVATFLSLLATALLALLFVKLANLSGLGSEDVYSLIQGFQHKIQFQGLLLGGIIIGALGVLDDVTTTQTATIFALAETDPKLTMKDLFQKGMSIGREHIASLVNTLVLAYAGASLGLFIYLMLGQQMQNQPLWVMLNSEAIAEEVVRTLAGSFGLILAVPITTLLAAFFAKYSLKIR